MSPAKVFIRWGIRRSQQESIIAGIYECLVVSVTTALAAKRGVQLNKVTGVKESSGNIDAFDANAIHIERTLRDVVSPVVETILIGLSAEKIPI